MERGSSQARGQGRDARGLVVGSDGRPRCWWCDSHEDYRAYHDREWGRPVTDDRLLFEKLCLEGFQSGLSWLTILRKREGFRAAFANFDFVRVARFNDRSVERLLRDESIVRHRGKLRSAINNAKRARELVEEFGSLAAYFWAFEPEPMSRPRRITRGAVPSQSDASVALSRDLKRRGWTFVGPTTLYAFMQAMGIVNDHLEGCFARDQVERRRLRVRRPR